MNSRGVWAVEAGVRPGSSQQFSAVGYDQYRNRITDAALQWSATGGGMDDAGTFVAPGDAGLYEVAVAASFGGEELTQTVRVGVGTPPGRGRSPPARGRGGPRPAAPRSAEGPSAFRLSVAGLGPGVHEHDRRPAVRFLPHSHDAADDA